MSDKTREELEQALAEAREVIEFYADNELWCEDQHLDLSEYPNLDNEFESMVGGKRAREWLKKWGG